jgi:ABC-type polysaccharide transport system permease subunit
VTDPKWEERCKVLGYGAHTNFALLVEETDRVLLTVSLEEPDFSNNPAVECFKSVVGVILLPGAKGAGTKD